MIISYELKRLVSSVLRRARDSPVIKQTPQREKETRGCDSHHVVKD